MNPGDYMDHMRAEAARQDAEAKNSAEREATPEELATQRVHGQMDRLIESGREAGTLIDGREVEQVIITKLDSGLRYTITRQKSSQDVEYGQIIKTLTAEEHSTGTHYQVKPKHVVAGQMKMDANETNWLADELTGL